MSTNEELHACLYLSRAVEPPAPAVYDYVAVHGPIDTLAAIRVGSAPPAVLAEVTRPDTEITDDLRAIDQGLARLITPSDADWPTGRLSGLTRVDSGAPLCLWVRGHASLADLTGTAVTVTGSRAATTYGQQIATDVGFHLARHGVTVVAGGSYGVESSSHSGVLAADGPIVVVLPCGVDIAHPHSHEPLFRQIVANGGLLVSEYPTGAQPSRRRFAARARLLAALSTATVVVEAGRRSGALTVARWAGELHRRLYGVPGPVTSANSVGVHELLRTGAATLITSADQIDYREGLR